MRSCIFECGRKARKYGKECRTCYQRIKKREEREKAREDGWMDNRPIPMSPEDLGLAMDRQAYQRWFDDNF